MKKNKIKFIIAGVLLLISAIFVFFFNDVLIHHQQFLYPIFFAYFLYDLLEVLIPRWNKDTYSSKMLKRTYLPVENYDIDKLNEMNQSNNRKALLIFILYVLGVIIFGLSYLYFSWFTTGYLILIFFGINFADYFCIIIWCPFKNIFLKNECCNTCRISNWDRLMKTSILLFIPNFYTISINVLALIVFIYWEYIHYLYPHRFYRLSNRSLWCSNCNNKTCGKPL